MSQRRPAYGNGSRPYSEQSRRPQNGNYRGRPAPRRRRKGPNPVLIFIILALVIAVVAFVIVKLAKPDDAVVNHPTESAAPTATESIYTPPSQSELAALLSDEDSVLTGLTEDQQVDISDLEVTEGLDSEWLNILLLGGDARSLVESCRTDTIMICSVNTETGEVKLTSIMRDIAVLLDDIGEFSGTYRINSAYYFGGPELAMRTINRMLGMNIQYYAFVNFYGFQQIVHDMGGIEMDITEAEMRVINERIREQYVMGVRYGIDQSGLTDEYGVDLTTYGEDVHLNGYQTLAYCRIRELDSDMSRAERQRKVLVALLGKAKSLSAMELTALMSTASQYVETNLNLDYILQIALQVLEGDLAHVDQLRLPLNKTYVSETRNEHAMLYDCDWTANTEALYDHIYGG